MVTDQYTNQDEDPGSPGSGSRFSAFRNDWDALEFKLIAHLAEIKVGDLGQVHLAVAWIRANVEREAGLRAIRGVRNGLLPYQRARVDVAVDHVFGAGARGSESEWGKHPIEAEVRESAYGPAADVLRKLRWGEYDHGIRS